MKIMMFSNKLNMFFIDLTAYFLVSMYSATLKTMALTDQHCRTVFLKEVKYSTLVCFGCLEDSVSTRMKFAMSTMASIAMLYLILLEPFLAIKLNEVKQKTPPVSSSSKNSRSLFLQRTDPKLTKFFLFTPKSSRDGRTLSVFEPESFENFDPSIDTKVIIHGFLDKVQIADWMHEMKDELLKYGKFNVIVVDWSSGNTIPYSQAAANTERVGEEIAKLLAFLRDRMGGKIETFHLIGHSLGSHVAGFVGENIKHIGRITGLDPAMYHFKDAVPAKRLDRSDATLVEAIHTDAGGIGIVDPVGHVDFYPNGGSLQPGCTAVNYLTSLLQKGVVESVRSLICSHMRAVTLFTESINSQTCQFRASKCQSWKDYEDGRCGNCGVDGQSCAIMGFHLDPARNYGNSSYFLMTAAISPYCVQEYRVTLIEVGDGRMLDNLLMPAWRAVEAFSGKDYLLTLLGNLGEAEILLEERNMINRRHYSVTSPRNLGVLDRALLRWKPKPVGAAVDAVASVFRHQQNSMPLVTRIEVTQLNMDVPTERNKFILCASPNSLDSQKLIVGLSDSFC